MSADTFRSAIAELYQQAGTPSYREMSRATGLSHSQAGEVATGRRIPRWVNAEKLVRFLNGDVDALKRLWVAEHSDSPPPLGPLEARRPTLDEFAGWLDGEAERLRDNRWKLHGGTRNRYDLDHWSDALKWAARKARQQAETARQERSET